MSRLFSALLFYRRGFSLRASQSIACNSELGNKAGAAALLLFVAWIGLDGFNDYVDDKVDIRTAQLLRATDDLHQRMDHAEKTLVTCMNGGAIRTGESTAIFCDPSKEQRL